MNVAFGDHQVNDSQASVEAPHRRRLRPPAGPFPRPLAEQQLVSDFFDGAIQAGDNCGGGPCFAGSFSAHRGICPAHGLLMAILPRQVSSRK